VPPLQVTFGVHGELGDVPADIATPLAVVLAELLQNAVEHAFLGTKVGGAAASEAVGDRDREADCTDRPVASVGHIDVNLDCRLSRLIVEVRDDGAGLPDSFDIDLTQSLGLSIVRDLVRSQLGGTITMSAQPGGHSGTVVVLDVPLEHPRPLR
ncbi:MAG TPA: ATP-binding protein, partial [Acidimicrobiales bacterium]|nr:ATP-binding protein [Acidimicrobiales bacterium]